MAKRAGPNKTTWRGSVSISSALQRFVRERVAEGAYQSPDEFVEQLLTEEKLRVSYEKRRLVRMIEDGIKSGPGTVADEKFWKRLEGELGERHGSRRKAG